MTSGLAGRRILVVEDEVMVAWGLEDMLHRGRPVDRAELFRCKNLMQM
jgi:hypothetical protein